MHRNIHAASAGVSRCLLLLRSAIQLNGHCRITCNYPSHLETWKNTLANLLLQAHTHTHMSFSIPSSNGSGFHLPSLIFFHNSSFALCLDFQRKACLQMLYIPPYTVNLVFLQQPNNNFQIQEYVVQHLLFIKGRLQVITVRFYLCFHVTIQVENIFTGKSNLCVG